MKTLAFILLLIVSLGYFLKSNAKTYNCDLTNKKIYTKKGIITTPHIGRWVIESHYATTAEEHECDGYPCDINDGIDKHLKLSCFLLKSNNCNGIYNTWFKRVYQPNEGLGKIGQGCVGKIKPTPWEEMWFGTMYWRRGKKPKIGTRMILSYGGRAVSVVFGYETGPSTSHVGGLTPEVHWYLGTNSDSNLTLSYPSNQDIPLGPIKCGGY